MRVNERGRPVKEITLDFSACANWFDVHKVLQKQLSFPYHYGMNLDALWDCLTGYMETSIMITIHLNGLKKGAVDEVGSVDKVINDAAAQDSEIKINYV